MFKSRRFQLVWIIMLAAVLVSSVSILALANPKSIDIVVDKSGSMSSLLDLAYNFAQSYISSQPSSAMIATLLFDTNVRVLKAHQHPPYPLPTLSAGGGTWIWNAASEALEYQWPEGTYGGCHNFVGYDKWVIIVTDGLDWTACDPVTEAQVRNEALQHHKHFCVVQITCCSDLAHAMSVEASAMRPPNVKLVDVGVELERLAKYTGGIYLKVSAKGQEKDAAMKVAEYIRSH